MSKSGAQTPKPGAIAQKALAAHARYRGKIQSMLKCPVTGTEDFKLWYTPGVAAPCREIHQSPEAVYQYTNKGNTVAIVTDGSRILGLGNIGPEAGLPVMEGKALLFKYLGGVDAVPLCLRARSADEIVSMVEALEPSFGGVNLEDISQPKCFDVLDRLRGSLGIPVWHDDQQGTAVVVLAAVMNALEIVGKRIGAVKIALVGVGAANVANYRMLKAAGADPGGVVACDTGGVLGPHRQDIEAQQSVYRDKWAICQETNDARLTGGIAEALRGADLCIAFSKPDPGTIAPDWVTQMADKAIVMACANPAPEIWPEDAKAAGALIAATGRCDLPNQVNNALAFPGIFRGVFDVRARALTVEMAIAAARALAKGASLNGAPGPDRLLPTLGDWQIAANVAAATGMEAQRQGLAAIALDRDRLHALALARITAARDAAGLLDYDSFEPKV